MKCKTCEGLRWICETHAKPRCDCGAALKPCRACNPNAMLPRDWMSVKRVD